MEPCGQQLQERLALAHSHCTAYSPCPLCGRGEAGAEHLLVWCHVVARAWHLLTGGARGTIRSSLCKKGADLHFEAAFFHQVMFQNVSLRDVAVADPENTVHRIVRATCNGKLQFQP